MAEAGRLFDDLSRVASGALGALAGVKGEVEGLARRAGERVADELHLPSREEVETAFALAQAARSEQEALTARIAALEAQVAALIAQTTPAAAAPAASAAADGTGDGA